MRTSPNPQPEQLESIQDRYAKAQDRYGVMRAVIDRPDVPAKGKLLLALSWPTITGIGLLGIRSAPLSAYYALVACILAIALLISRIKDPTGRSRREWARPPKPRPRREHKG